MSCLDETTIVQMAAGELQSPSALRQLHCHLDVCPACRELVAEVARVVLPAAPGLDLPPDANAPVAPGARLGRYLLISRVGAGAMGVVYSAWDPELDRRIALKVVVTSTDSSGRPRERMVREARAIARISHPNVIVVHDVGHAPGGIFIAMEFLGAGNLRQWLARPRPWRSVVERFVHAGRGLAAAHAAGLVHHDFKPDNVLLGGDGRVRVTDFGLARSVEAAASLETDVPARTLSSTIAPGGTPAYMAPEQHAGEPADERSDQYAFCVALHEALLGRRPFDGGTVTELREAIESNHRQPVPSHRVPRAVLAVVDRGLSRRPEQRYSEMQGLVAALESAAIPRRRWLAPAAVLGVSAAVAVTVARSRPACTDPVTWPDSWGLTQRATIAGAFSGTDLPYATDVWTRTQAAIDDYVAAFAETEQLLCTSVREGAITRARYDERLACLDERRAEAVALMAVLATPDRGAVERAIEGALGLRAPLDCTEHEGRTLPMDPQRARAVAQVARELGAIDVLNRLGRHDPAESESRRLLVVAEHSRDAISIARVHNRWGRALHGLGRFEDARTAYLRAGTEAIRGGDSAAAATAWTAIYILEGVELGANEQADTWSALADAALDAAPSDPVRRAVLAAYRGHVLRARGDLRGATDAWREAIRRFEDSKGSDDPDTAKARARLGEMLLLQDDPDGARGEVERALQIQRRAFGSMHREVATSLSILAGALNAQGEGPRAVRTYEEAITITKAVQGPEHPHLASPLANLGVTLLDGEVRDDTRALENFERAAAIYRTAHGAAHPSTIAMNNNIALVLARLGRTDEALGLRRDLLAALLDAGMDEHPTTAKAHLGLGTLLLTLEHPDEARVQARRAASVAEAVYGPEHREVAYACILEGHAADAAGSPDIAPLLRAMAIAHKQPLPADSGAELRFALARTKASLGHDEAEVRALAGDALAIATGAAPKMAGEIRAWLEKRDDLTGTSPVPAHTIR